MRDSAQQAWRPAGRQPVFNLPPVVVGVLAVLFAIHVVRAWFLNDQELYWLFTTFGFIPREAGAHIWTFVTYALLHASWAHLLINGVWLAAFGSPLAWRFGPSRFLAFSVVGAVAGAALHMAIYPRELAPMIGASAAISAHMAGASRFVFSQGGPLWRGTGLSTYRKPAPPLAAVVRDARVVIFVGVWFAINLIFGLGWASSGIASGTIAWDAHIGGFIAGLLLFPLFDPVSARG